MFSSRFAALSLLAFAFPALASPMVGEPAAGTALEKRVTHQGRGTWFDVGLGNCGWNNVDSDYIVAISIERYQDSNASNCGQWMHITNTANGHTVWAKTSDSCQSCGYDDIDLSPAAFGKLASLDAGVIKASWHFESKTFAAPRQ